MPPENITSKTLPAQLRSWWSRAVSYLHWPHRHHLRWWTSNWKVL